MTLLEQHNNEIYHYGVKGMKWGVRRYQNADGSLTPAGQKRLYGSLKKYAKKKDHRQMLGVGVKENATIAEAAHKAKVAAKKHSLAVAKETELENLAEYGSTPKIRNEAYQKYKNASRATINAYNEYRDLTKKLADEYLGEYANQPVKTLKNGKHVTAGEAFCMQVEWGIGMGWVKSTSNMQKKLYDFIDKEYSKKVKTAKNDDEKELIELEWMEKLDDLDNYYVD